MVDVEIYFAKATAATNFERLNLLPHHTETIVIANNEINVCVPNVDAVQQRHTENSYQPFPYWAKKWPASLGLANFILRHPTIIEKKRVLELAAGLGLPSLLAAKFASTVVCSDYLEEPLLYVRQSIQHNQLKNISTSIIDWNFFPATIDADIILMSDINYNPLEFDVLLSVFEKLLQQQKTIILSTPQRIMAKPFIEKLLPHCVQQENFFIEKTDVSVLVFK